MSLEERDSSGSQPLSWGPALSAWFREPESLERARQEILARGFTRQCSQILLSRTETVRRLGFFIEVKEIDLQCCHVRRGVIEVCTRVAGRFDGVIEARRTCAPFTSERLPHRYSYADARLLVRAEFDTDLDTPPFAQGALFGLTRLLTTRLLELPPISQLTVVARSGRGRFLLAGRALSRSSTGMIVDPDGTVVAVARSYLSIVAVGGWSGVTGEEANEVRRQIYRRANEGTLIPW